MKFHYKCSVSFMDKKRKQISFNVSEEFHKEIKVQAAMRNISINLLIVRAIYEYLRSRNVDI